MTGTGRMRAKYFAAQQSLSNHANTVELITVELTFPICAIVTDRSLSSQVTNHVQIHKASGPRADRFKHKENYI